MTTKLDPKDFNLEAEIAEGLAKELTDANLRSTRGYFPFVASILDKLGAELISNEEVQRLFLEHGNRSWGLLPTTFYQGDVSVEVSIDANVRLPSNYPTLDYLRNLSDEYFWRPVLNRTNSGIDVPYSLAKLDDRYFVRVHMTKDELERAEARKT